MKMLATILTLAAVVLANDPVHAQSTIPSTRPDAMDYHAAARDVMRHIQESFYLPEEGLYAESVTERSPAFMWSNGIMFSALAGAVRHEPRVYAPVMNRFFDEMDRYWDKKANIPGYEPSPTHGNGHDKYYDDNQWMVLTFAEAYDMTGDRRFLKRADETLTFSLSGWDDVLGGGIWWHEGHKEDSKNTCSNAPAAVACLKMATYMSAAKAKQSVQKAENIVAWTMKTFQDGDGLFADSINVKTGKKNGARLTYNTALMIRAYLGLHRATGEDRYLIEAKRVSVAADWFLDQKTHAYRDSVKWSHLQVEADLEMYRATGEEYLLRRAVDNATHQYATWKEMKPDTLIDNASIARTLWLLADAHTEAGRKFWKQVDKSAGSEER